jgi:large subunit ribosomal protein L1|tara:strand:+ start:459 stop:1151 length:693 start_codon:yes stop_codon:yes gene_type:complete
MKKKSKRYKEILKISKGFKSTNLNEILELIKKNSTTKFDESIDVNLRIGLKQSKGGDFNLRTVTQLPAGTGKKIKIAVLCESEKAEEAKKCGADVVGSDDLIEKIAIGKFNFDKLICTPGMMGKIGKHGKVLGPKGLMPNPKLGTVSTNIKKSVEDIKSGLIEIKHDKDGNIGTSIGRKSFSIDNLVNNLKHLVDFVQKEKPDAIKGDFIKSIYVTSSMGTSIKVSNKSI